MASGAVKRFVCCEVSCLDLSVMGGESFYLNCPEEATHIKDCVAVTLPPSSGATLQTLRMKRNNLLTACDWTQTSDAPLTAIKKEEWVSYRQALRDFTETCDPYNPVWPQLPV